MDPISPCPTLLRTVCHTVIVPCSSVPHVGAVGGGRDTSHLGLIPALGPSPQTLLPHGVTYLNGVATCPPSASTDQESPGLECVPGKGPAHRLRSKGHA